MGGTVYGILVDGPEVCKNRIISWPIEEDVRRIEAHVHGTVHAYHRAKNRFHQGANAYMFYLYTDANRNRLQFEMRTGDDAQRDIKLDLVKIATAPYWSEKANKIMRVSTPDELRSRMRYVRREAETSKHSSSAEAMHRGRFTTPG